jgi:polysaccharide biosynthesis transport protein
MFSGKGDKSSGRGKSLLRLAEEQIARRRDAADPRARLDQIAFPDVSILTDAEKHRRARIKRERVDNPLLGELGSRPEQFEVPELPALSPEPRRPQAWSAAKERTQPVIPSVLEQFAKIDSDLRARAEAGALPLAEAATPHASESNVASSPGSEWRPLVDPRHVFDAVRRLKGLLVLCTALGTGVGLISAMSTEKLYYSTAEIQVDPRGLKVIDNSVNPDGFLADSFAVVDSQLGIIRSPTVLEKVVDDEKLFDDPEFNGDRETGWIDALSDIFSGEDAQSDKTKKAAKTLGTRVYVERGAKTYNITVTAGSEDSDKAARLAGKIVGVYMAEQRRQQSDQVQQASDDLAAPLEALKERVEAAEKLVSDFKAENDLVGVDGRMIDDESILRTNDQLAAAKGQTIAANARAKSAKEITLKGVVDGAVPEELNSTVLNTLRGQYSIAKQKLDGMATRLGERHPNRIQAETELSSIRSSINAELQRVSAAMQTDLKRAIQTEQDLAARLAELKQKQGENGTELIRLRELQRDLDVRRSVYEARLLRAGQTAGQVSLNTSNISLIVPPRAPEEPVGPSRKLIVLAGAIGGFALGLALAILKGVIDSLGGQMSGARPARRQEGEPSPTPGGGGGGGMFQPRQQMSVSEEVRNTLNALKARTAPAMQRAPESAQAHQHYPAAATPPFASGPMPQQAVGFAPYAPAPHPHIQQPGHPQWHNAPSPAFQPQVFAHPPVQPGPMMYPHPSYAPQQPAFVPQQPVFIPQPQAAQIWAQPMPQMVQMPSAPAHPFAHEAVHPAHQAPAAPAAAPQIFNIHQAPVSTGGDARLDDIQRSIEEFRSALTDFARRKSA